MSHYTYTFLPKRFSFSQCHLWPHNSCLTHPSLQWDRGGGIGQQFTYSLLSKTYVSSRLIVQGSGYSHKGAGRAEGPCPRWDEGILKTMERDFSKRNTVLYQKAYIARNAQLHFPRVRLLYLHALWWLRASWSQLSSLGEQNGVFLHGAPWEIWSVFFWSWCFQSMR